MTDRHLQLYSCGRQPGKQGVGYTRLTAATLEAEVRESPIVTHTEVRESPIVTHIKVLGVAEHYSHRGTGVVNCYPHKGTGVAKHYSHRGTGVANCYPHKGTGDANCYPHKGTGVAEHYSHRDTGVANCYPHRGTESPIVTHREVWESPNITHTEVRKSPIIIHTEVLESPSITHTEVRESPNITHTEVWVSPNITYTEVRESPIVTHTEVRESPSITHTGVRESPSITHTEVRESPVITHTHNVADSGTGSVCVCGGGGGGGGLKHYAYRRHAWSRGRGIATRCPDPHCSRCRTEQTPKGGSTLSATRFDLECPCGKTKTANVQSSFVPKRTLRKHCACSVCIIWTEGSGLSVTRTLQPDRTSELTFRQKVPKSGSHSKAQMRTTELQIGWFQIIASKTRVVALRYKTLPVECLDTASHCYSQYTMPILCAQGLVVMDSLPWKP